MHTKLLTAASFACVAAGQGLLSALRDQPDLTNLTSYLNYYPDLLSQIDGMSNITILAPSNDAFAEARDSGGAFASNDTDTITALFSYHVLQGTYASFEDMPTKFVATALRAQPDYANVTGGQRVQAVAISNQTSTTTTVTTTTFTSGLLHNSTVLTTANFTGGIIHVVDSFLTIPPNITNTVVQLGLRAAYGAFDTTGLGPTIDSTPDVTAFVPNDEAIQAISGVLSTASAQEISRILEYHVVNGTVGYSTGLRNGTTLTTMNGLDLTITVEDGAVFVNSARVVTPNVLVANGVVHVIDNVLNPGNQTATPNPSASTQEPAFGPTNSASMATSTGGVPTATASVTTGSGSASESGAAATSSGGAMPMKTGAVGAAALFGAIAGVVNM